METFHSDNFDGTVEVSYNGIPLGSNAVVYVLKAEFLAGCF